MNQVISLVQVARASSDPGAVLYSDHMLAELQALDAAMIAQLRLERLGAVGNDEFLASMIRQHEKNAALLRAQLEHRDTDTINDGVIDLTGEASSEARRALATKIAQGIRGEKSVSRVKPLVRPEVAQQTASANDASRHNLIAPQPAAGTANHARHHHVSRHTQS